LLRERNRPTGKQTVVNLVETSRRQKATSEGFSANRRPETDVNMHIVLRNVSQQMVEVVRVETRRYRGNASGFPVGHERRAAVAGFFYHYTHGIPVLPLSCHCDKTDAAL
jgi:hypothetical protein